MAHRAGIHRKARKSQRNQFVYPFLYNIQIFLIPCCLVSLRHTVIGYAAGPVPGHIHIHGALCHFINRSLNHCLIIVKFHIRPFRCSLLFIRPFLSLSPLQPGSADSLYQIALEENENQNRGKNRKRSHCKHGPVVRG